MSVTAVVKDTENLTMTVLAEFDVTAERAWQLWADPRQLERWWGPPTYPATFVHHDLRPGGSAAYYMTGPDGQPHGWWRILEVEAPRRLVFEDGFATADGSPDPSMPTMTMRLDITDRDGRGVTMSMRTTFPSLEAMDRLLGMGMEEGLSSAISQIDALLEPDLVR